MSQSRVPVPELGINSSKPYRQCKSPFISLMVINNGGNKLFLCAYLFPAMLVEQKIVKIKGHNFTGVYPSPI